MNRVIKAPWKNIIASTSAIHYVVIVACLPLMALPVLWILNPVQKPNPAVACFSQSGTPLYTHGVYTGCGGHMSYPQVAVNAHLR